MNNYKYVIEELKRELEEVKEEKEFLIKMYTAYGFIEDEAQEVIDRAREDLPKNIFITLWRNDEFDTDEDDWDLTITYVDLDNDIDEEVKIDLWKELEIDLNLFYELSEEKEFKTNRYKNCKQDLEFEIRKIINEMYVKLIKKLY